MVSVTDKDKGWSAIMRSLAGSGAAKLSAYVGPDPAVIAEAATAYYPFFVEYGLGPGAKNVGPRPFIRFTLDAHDNYREQLKVMAGRVLDRARDGDVFLSLAASLRSLADSVAKDIQRTIQGLGAIDTARMYHSVKCLRVVTGDDSGTGGSVSVVKGA